MGRTRMRCHPSQEPKPNIGVKRNDAVRGALWRKTRCILTCCNWRKSVRAYAKGKTEKNWILTISKESWWDLEDHTCIEFGSRARTRSEYPTTSVSWEKRTLKREHMARQDGMFEAVPLGNRNEAQRKERIIYAMVEVLPAPRPKPSRKAMTKWSITQCMERNGVRQSKRNTIP